MSWKPEIKAFGEKGFTRNGLNFATKEESDGWAEDLSYRWFMVEEWRSVEVDSVEFPVNYKYDGVLHSIEEVKCLP